MRDIKAMDFWAAQQKARSKTSLYLFLFVALTFAVAIALELAIRSLDPEDYNVGSLPLLAIIFTVITFGVAGFQYQIFRFSGGG
jgi:heat shock protein HtpX